MGHGAGGKTSRRLLARLGIVVSGNTVLRYLKHRARRLRRERKLRVVGVDEWAWRKGAACGTILVDLETRTVADVLPDRSSALLASWLSQHPGVEIVCRDRHGLYAEGAHDGAGGVVGSETAAALSSTDGLLIQSRGSRNFHGRFLAPGEQQPR